MTINPDLPYEDDNFVELQKLPPTGSKDGFCFVIQHKASETIFRAIAKDRDELAAKITAGQYEDVDPRNDTSPPDLDEDATDE